MGITLFELQGFLGVSQTAKARLAGMSCLVFGIVLLTALRLTWLEFHAHTTISRLIAGFKLCQKGLLPCWHCPCGRICCLLAVAAGIAGGVLSGTGRMIHRSRATFTLGWAVYSVVALAYELREVYRGACFSGELDLSPPRPLPSDYKYKVKPGGMFGCKHPEPSSLLQGSKSGQISTSDACCAGVKQWNTYPYGDGFA
jgi:hypothetical protein